MKLGGDFGGCLLGGGVREIGTQLERDDSGKELYVASYTCSRFLF
jgi:hypothetical protein